MKKYIYLLLLLVQATFCVTSLSSCLGCGSDSFYDSYSDSSEEYGEYHNVYTGKRQTSYQGSVEQQKDIAELDKMIEEGY